MLVVKRHRFDPLSFLFGAVFLAVGLTFLFSGSFPEIRPSRIWPAAMIAVGLTLGTWAVATAVRHARPGVTVDVPEIPSVPEATEEPEGPTTSA
jgi:hypothetical protein